MIRIRRLSEEDLDTVVSIHMQLFGGDYSTSLGYGFVRKHYYGILMDDKYGFGFLAYDDVSLAGFIFGAYDSKKVSRLRRTPQIIYTILRGLANPRKSCVWLRMFFNAKRKFEPPFKAELVSLSVKKEFQGMGIGRILVREFKRHMQCLDIDGCWTKTYSPQAAHIYESEGFRDAGGFDFLNRRYKFYVWENRNG